MNIKNLKLAFLFALPVLAFSNTAKADNYGCEALLCFAGGKGLSECQPTVKRVLRDLSKGKGFPHCSFVKGDGVTENNAISTRMFTERSNRPICRDGVTRANRSFVGYYCKTIEINVKPEYAADKEHQKQYFNY